MLRISSCAVDASPDEVRSIAFTSTDERCFIYPASAFTPALDLSASQTFTIRQPWEYLVAVRGLTSFTDDHLMGVQFQTNLGRSSPWYGARCRGKRFELVVEGPTAGFAIVGLEMEHTITAVIPGPTKLPALKPRSVALGPALLGRAASRSSSSEVPTPRSLSLNAKSFAVDFSRRSNSAETPRKLGASAPTSSDLDARTLVSGLASLASRAGGSEADCFANPPADAQLVKLVMEGGEQNVLVPESLVRAADEWNLLAVLQRAGAWTPQLLFDRPVKDLFKVLPDASSLASLMLAPNPSLGEPSLAQLALNRMSSRPSSCVLLEMLFEDGKSPSFARALLSPALPGKSLLGKLIASNLLLRLLQSNARAPSILRRIFSSTHAFGRPALAEYLWLAPVGGLSPMSVLLHEPEQGDSMLGLLLRPASGSCSLLELFLGNSLLGLLLEGEDEDQETSLMRDALSSAYSIWDSRQTLVQAGLAGEVDYGMCLLRLLVIPDELGGSILELLLLGDDKPQGCILRELFLGYRQFLATCADDTSVFASLKSLQVYYNVFNCILAGLKRIERADANFKRRWKSQWQLVASRLGACSEANKAVPLVARTSPKILPLCELIGDLQWNMAAIKLAGILFSFEENATLSWLGSWLEPLAAMDMTMFS